jgi:dUTP pyrophosphatase
MNVYIKKLHPEAIIPKYQTKGASGFDLHALIPNSWSVKDKKGILELNPGERSIVPTGLAFEIPYGYEMQIRPRSGLAAKYGITIVNTPGTVDSDYRGEVSIILLNTSSEPVYIECKDRIAQGVIVPVVQAELIEVTELSDTQRGEGKFGSTGK